ncbi:unnamed protein product [Cunninghamella blakesleeana]
MLFYILVLSSLLFFTPSLSYASPTAFQKHLTPLGVPYRGPPIKISKKLYKTKKVPFVEHNEGVAWLGMQVDFQYVKPVFDSLNSTRQPLQSRGEAHITVISPPEFNVLASVNITIQDINKIAKKNNIQSSPFKAICLGKVSQKDDVVYQIIVTSPALVKIREEIFRLYYSKQGNVSLFDPRSFWPHITIGFTDHDLFIEGGVYKGFNACYRPITLH